MSSDEVDRRGPWVFVLTLFYPPSFGGASARMGAQIQAIRKAGFRPVIFTSFPQYPHGRVPEKYARRFIAFERSSDADVCRVRLPSIPFVGVLSRLVIFLYFCLVVPLLALSVKRKYPRITAVYAVHPTLLVFFPGIVVSRVLRVPLVLGVMDLWPEAFVMMKSDIEKLVMILGRPLARLAYTHSNHIVTFNKRVAHELQVSYEVPGTKISVIHGPVDTVFFSPMPREKARLSLSQNVGFAISNSEFVIAYLGIFSTGYDFEALLNIAEVIQGKSLEAIFLLIGEGEVSTWVHEETQRRGLQNVKMVSSLPRSLVPGILSAADMCLLHLRHIPTNKFVLGSKLSEYLACGRPVLLLGPRSETSDLVEQEECGVYCSDSDPDAVTQVISELMSQPARLEMMGKKGREVAIARFSIDQGSQAFRQLLSASSE